MLNQTDVALLLLRASVGFVMVAHGYNHLFRGGRIQGTANWFGDLGMRPPLLHAWLASVTELAAGILLVAGFLTPLAAGAVVGTMVVAWTTHHARNGFFIFHQGEGYEYVMTLTFAGLALGGLGPGRLSLDAALEVLDWGDWSALAAAAAVGLGGASLLLATCWQPPASQSLPNK